MKKQFLLTIVLLFVAFFAAQPTAAQAPVDSPEEAITGLLNRIGGNGAADKFEIVINANLAENGKDVFIITSQNGKPCIKGNTQLSVATGINWYLNHYAHINLTWNNLTTDLSQVTLPVPTSEEKHVSSAKYRYDFNTCTFSYSMAFWTWDRWQQEIDWMALHGINAPLNLVGLDVVTRKFLQELGVSESDIDAYIAGPGFIAWFAMNNLEGWGGTINSSSTGVQMNGNPDWWYTRQENLCRNMLQRMRELGMQPVIPGFSGQIPNSLSNYTITGFSSGDVINGGTWAGGYTRPDILHPNSSSYATLAPIYYKHLEAVMGVSEFYSMDPFHEGGLPGAVTNATCYPPIMAALDTYHNAVEDATKTSYNVSTDDNQAKWIIQYWQNIPQSGAFSSMSSYGDRFIGLDLFSDNIYADNAAKWRGTGEDCYYKGRPYIYCMLHNFGGRSGLHGRLETTMDGYFKALANNNNCQGIGATPEGTETNPILYDMLFELPWMDVNNRPTADEWLAEYAHSRYGVDSKTAPAALEALKNLKKSVWDCKVNQQGTSEAVILARPNWTIGSVSAWSTSAIYWDTQDVLLAADQLCSVKDFVTANGGVDGIANYNYDFIDVVRQAMVDYAAQLLPLINAARGNDAEYTRLYQLYLQLMLDLDEMLSYDENFKLERWTSLARNIANEVGGTTENDRNWLEWNARTQVTVWSKGNTDLHDYSNRCWAGLIKDFHYKRWEKFFTTKGGSFDGGWFSGFEYPWTVDFNNTYNLAGDYSKVVIPTDMTATEKAAQTFGNYFGRVKSATKNYIFPMGVATNATKSDVIPEVYRGKEVELPLIIGKNVTISSVWVDLNNDGNAGNGETLTANGNNVTIPADAAIGKTTAKVTYSDGTVITFNLALIEDITSERTVTAVAGANGSVAIEGTNELSITTTEAVKMTATANTGYNFEEWTDAQGNVVSNDNPFIYYGKEAATFTANFIQDKWGVVACGYDEDNEGNVKDEAAVMNDISNNKQYIPELTLAYYNREAETIFEAISAPTSIFTTIPQIINVPQGASFDIEYKGVDNFKHCYFRAYIDLNADGDFADEGELLKEVGTKGAQNTAVCSNKVNVLLPYDMPLGITHLRMRFDSAWNIGEGAKDPSVRPVYEIIINVTEKSDKAATINVETNSTDWGTVEVWTDETPDGSTGTEWVVSANIPMYLRATKASEDVEFLGWYDQYGRLLTENLEHTMYAREDATYTARFRKFLEIGGWEIEYRTQPGKDVVTTKLANGVKPEAGKKYYIAADAKQSDGSFVSHYLYDNGSALKTATSVNGNSYLWTCIVNDDKTYSFQNESGKYLANDGNYHLSIGETPAKYAFETANAGSGVALTNVSDGYTGSKWMVTKFDGSAFNKNSVSVNNGSWCNDYIFVEVSTPDVVILTKVRKSGNHDLVIPETVEILGQQCKIVGFDNNLFKDNKDLWSISLPSTIEEMSNILLFSTSVKGENTPTATGDTNPDNKLQVINLGFTLKNSEHWTIRATYKSDGVSTFNGWGTPLLYPNENGTGKELFYLSNTNQWSSCWHVRSPFSDLGNDYFKEHTNTKISTFIAAIENKGNGKAVITITNSEGQSMTSSEVAFSYDNISAFSAKLPKGLDITNFEVLAGAEPDPFEGCTNLLDITIADGGCQGGYTVDGREFKNASDVVLHTLADKEKEEELRALGELIDLTNDLIAEVATNVYPTGKATALTLSTTAGEQYYIYSNAEIREGAIGNLLDNDNESYIHTTWEKNSTDGLHHYLRVFLGDEPSLNDFSFSYVTRNNSNNEKPKQITVAGCDTENGSYETIAVLTDLPEASAEIYESPVYSAKGYKYLRFMVDDTYRDLSNSGHKAYSLAKFDLYSVSSIDEVKPAYANLAGVTATEVENVYDKLAEALYYYNNGGTADELTAAYNVLQPLYEALNTKKDKVFNGVYNINFNNVPVFVAYLEGVDDLPGGNNGAYRLFDGAIAHDGATDGNTDSGHIARHQSAIDAKAVGDALFTIVPNDAVSGYTISAQGYYLENTYNGWWGASAFSPDKEQAGVYLFEETEGDIYKLKCAARDWLPYVNDWEYVFGNSDPAATYSTFTLSQVTEYTLSVPANGVTTLCLPFNVVLPTGVTAYDLADINIRKANRYSTYELAQVATEGDVLAKNTPVIIKAAANDYTLTITMNDEGAKGSVENSVLRSGIVKTTLADGNNYTFDGVDFNLVAAGTVIPANQCYLQASENLGAKIYGTAPDFVLTTDEENPVLYKIISKRGDGNAKVLAYDEPTSEKIKIVDNAADNSYQAWYFVQGENGIIIKPYNADGRMLTIESIADGAGKAMIAADGASNFQEWSITKSTQNGCTDYYYIKAVGGEGNEGTFSHNGGFGVTSYMGVWADGFNSNDGGSLFKFVDAEFTDDNARFYQLNDYLPAMNQGIFVGESIGLYSEDGVNDLQAKYTEALSVINKGSNVSSSADCYDMYKELRAAKKDAYNAPAANKVYYIKSTADVNYCAGKYVHTYSKPHLHQNATWGNKNYDQRHLLFDAEGDIEQLSLAAFQFEETGTMGEYKMKNLHTGLYVKSFNNGAEHMGTEAEAQVVKIAGIADGQVTLKIGNNAPMHAQNDYSVIVSWNAAVNNASTWTIDEVPQEDLDKLYKLTVPESGVTTLNLAFNVEIPEGVTVYDIVESDITKPEDSERYEFRLTEITSDGDGFVLAANTPVVIKAEPGDYNLKAVLSSDDVNNSLDGSALSGTCWQTGAETGKHTYVFDAVKTTFDLSETIPGNTAYMVFDESKGNNIVEVSSNVAALPEINKVYRIKSVVTNTADEYKNHYLVNQTANLAIETTAADNNSDLWVCTVADKENNEYCFVSALGTAALGWMVADEEACVFSITTGIMPGTVTLSNGTNKLALGTENYNHNGKAELFESGDDVQALNFSTDWCFEEVTDAQISFTATVRGGSSYATMYLPYAVSIPSGVAAYYAHSLNDAGNKLNLTRIESVIPKNTAVLLYRGESNNAKANFVFSLADDVDAVTNLFEGCIKQTAIPARDSRVYLLLNYNSSEKFYYMADEYNENCSYVGSNGGHVKCDANKAYFKPAGATLAVSSFGFSYSGTTAIDDLEFEVIDATAIYDLQGRKVTEPVKGCIYIKVGKKFIAE